MTVKELAVLSQSPVKVLSGYDDHVFCHRFDPKNEKHKEIGDQEVIDLWGDIVLSNHTFGRSACAIIVCYIHDFKRFPERGGLNGKS